MLSRLVSMSGELYAGRWVASAETCKALSYATILVVIEEFQS